MIVHSWAEYAIPGRFNNFYRCLPFNNTGAKNRENASCIRASLTFFLAVDRWMQTSLTLTLDTSHPITAGLPGVFNQSQLTQYLTFGDQFMPGTFLPRLLLQMR